MIMNKIETINNLLNLTDCAREIGLYANDLYYLFNKYGNNINYFIDHKKKKFYDPIETDLFLNKLKNIKRRFRIVLYTSELFTACHASHVLDTSYSDLLLFIEVNKIIPDKMFTINTKLYYLNKLKGY